MRTLFIALASLLFCLPLLAQKSQMLTLVSPTSILAGVSERTFSIYLPRSYDVAISRSYPVFYLLHGGGESHSVWQRKGHIKELLDSLISAGVIDEMIVVCPEANENNMMYFNAPQWRFEDYFFSELIPYVEANYRVRSDRGSRAIAGFSMGGGGAVVYGVHHPELFSLVFDISGYLRRQHLDFLRNDHSAEWRQQVIEDNNPITLVNTAADSTIARLRQVDWGIAVGDHDFTLEANMDFVKALRSRHIEYTLTVHGGAHNWDFINTVLPQALMRANKHFSNSQKSRT